MRINMIQSDDGRIHEDMLKYYDVGLAGQVWYVSRNSDGHIVFFGTEEEALDFAMAEYRRLIVQNFLSTLS